MRLSRREFVAAGVAVSLWSESRKATAAPQSLEAGPIELKLAPAPAVAVRALGYGGQSPGPLLRMKAGEKLELAFHNALGEPTSLAFPGLRGARAQLAFGALGDPPIAAGATRDIVIAAREPGFQIYGALIGADPALQMARGLYGPLVVDEPQPPEVDLDAIALISDWRLDAAGHLADLADSALGRGPDRLAGVVSANGRSAPLALTAPPGGRVRLRLGNCAISRVLYVTIEGAKPLVVAVDGQPSAPFAPLRNLRPGGPGARFELMFDLPREPGATAKFSLRADETHAAGGDPPLLVFSTQGAAAPTRAAITGFAENPLLPAEIALERALRADIVIAGGDKAPLTINGLPSPLKPLFSAPRNSPVTLTFTNKTAYSQTVRITGHVARLLHNMDDGWDPYWRDVFILPVGKTVHAAFVADNPGLWPLESTGPERRNAGLMGVFSVA